MRLLGEQGDDVVVVLDNLSSHRRPRGGRRVRSSSSATSPTPPWSPRCSGTTRCNGVVHFAAKKQVGEVGGRPLLLYYRGEVGGLGISLLSAMTGGGHRHDRVLLERRDLRNARGTPLPSVEALPASRPRARTATPRSWCEQMLAVVTWARVPPDCTTRACGTSTSRARRGRRNEPATARVLNLIPIVFHVDGASGRGARSLRLPTTRPPTARASATTCTWPTSWTAHPLPPSMRCETGTTGKRSTSAPAPGARCSRCCAASKRSPGRPSIRSWPTAARATRRAPLPRSRRPRRARLGGETRPAVDGRERLVGVQPGATPASSVNITGEALDLLGKPEFTVGALDHLRETSPFELGVLPERGDPEPGVDDGLHGLTDARDSTRTAPARPGSRARRCRSRSLLPVLPVGSSKYGNDTRRCSSSPPP